MEPRQVVLIDDDEDLLFTTGLALRTGGFEPAPYRSCDGAVAALSEGGAVQPAIVLLDMHLGEGMAPASFVRWLREHGHARVPVLLVTGAPDGPAAARAMGADAHLLKPFSLPELLDRVNALAARSAQR
jgi:DNA-binding response OmpR family regulator